MPEGKGGNQTQTILAVAVGSASLVGAVMGMLSAALVAGLLNSTAILGTSLDGVPDRVSGADAATELAAEETATIAVVDRVAPAVVSVLIERRRADLGELYFDLYNDFLSSEEADALVETGGGTGFFVTSDGYIATNRHVVNDEDAVFTVVTSDGVELPATVVARDPYLDLAILDVEGDSYPTVSLGNSDAIRIGQTAIAIGNTLSEFRNTVTKGVVSGVNRRVYAGDDYGEEFIDHAIQTDAAINPGNSGGPLINLQGDVIGVNTAISYEGQSIGFAIPVNDIKKAINDVRAHGRIIRPWLGVRYITLTRADLEETGVESGALLIEGDQGEPAVVEGSPAERAGLQTNDIILAVNGQVLDFEHELGPLIGRFAPGDTIRLRVQRGDERLEIVCELAEAPDQS